jgi:hypothetical protein
MLVGDKGRFAVELGDEWWGDALRRVDLWVAGQWLTCEDDWWYVPSSGLAVGRAAEWVRAGGVPVLPFEGLSAAEAHRRLVSEDGDLYSRHRVFDWGPTTDNVIAFAFGGGSGERVAITVEFWREEHLQQHPEHVGQVFVAELDVAEFAAALEGFAAVLEREPTRPAGAVDLAAAASE